MTAVFALEAPAEFGQVVFASMPHREIELVVLRTTWNAGDRYHWFWHATWSRWVRRRNDEYRTRVKIGPGADGWTDREATLLRAVDELHDDLLISPSIGGELRSFLDERRILELCFITGHYELLAMTLGSCGVPYDGWSRPEPDDLMPRRPRLGRAGVTPGQLALAPDGAWWPADPAAAAVLDLHPFMRWSLRRLARASTRFATLDPADRDLAVRRLEGADVSAELVSEQQAVLLRGIDELDTEYFITDTTWQDLSRFLSTKQLIELCVLVGHVRTFRMMINSVRPADIAS